MKFSFLSNFYYYVLKYLFQVTRGDGYDIVFFEESVKMSTYLVAFVVCDYGFKEATTKKNTTVKYYYCYFQESCELLGFFINIILISINQFFSFQLNFNHRLVSLNYIMSKCSVGTNKIQCSKQNIGPSWILLPLQ